MKRARSDTGQARFYGSAKWKALRAQVRREEPVCRICQSAPTASVDHIDGNWRNNARGNLRGLCNACERSHTGRQHQAKRHGTTATGGYAPGCDEDGVPLDPRHHWRR